MLLINLLFVLPILFYLNTLKTEKLSQKILSTVIPAQEAIKRWTRRMQVTTIFIVIIISPSVINWMIVRDN